jgi:hypothetical protein
MKTSSAKKKVAAKRSNARATAGNRSPARILFPTEKSTIGRAKIERAVKEVIARRSS